MYMNQKNEIFYLIEIGNLFDAEILRNSFVLIISSFIDVF